MVNGFVNVGKIFELRKWILFMFSLLVIYRVGVFIMVFGVNWECMIDYM